jgi:small subunit ribosomal protein S20
MATHKSAIKEHRQSLVRRDRNRYHRSRLRTTIKKFRQAVADGDVEQARNLLPGSLSLLDTTVKHGAIHANVAARTKSRLSRALNRIASAQ